MEFIPSSDNLLIQQLNRKQNQSKLFICGVVAGSSRVIKEESDNTWIDIYQAGNPYTIDFINSFIWLNETRSILWASDKDGWLHYYQVFLEGKPEKLVTKGNFDIIDLKYIDSKKGMSILWLLLIMPHRNICTTSGWMVKPINFNPLKKYPTENLRTLYTYYLRMYCPHGGR